MSLLPILHQSYEYNSYNSYASFQLSTATSQYSLDFKIPEWSLDYTLSNVLIAWDPFALKHRPMGLVAHSEQERTTTVSFSSTEYISQWIDDADSVQVIPTTYEVNEGMKVHRGFYNLYLSMREKFYSTTTLNNTQVIIVGHSLGGAIATLFYGDMKSKGYKDVILYTFGSPRVGNPKYASYINSFIYCYRVNNIEDIVVNLPLPIMPRNVLYQQTCQSIDFSDNIGTLSLNHNQAYNEWLKTQTVS